MAHASSLEKAKQQMKRYRELQRERKREIKKNGPISQSIISRVKNIIWDYNHYQLNSSKIKYYIKILKDYLNSNNNELNNQVKIVLNQLKSNNRR